MSKGYPKTIALPGQVLDAYLACVVSTTGQVARSLCECSIEDAFVGSILQEPLIQSQMQWPRLSPGTIVDISLVWQRAYITGESHLNHINTHLFLTYLSILARIVGKLQLHACNVIESCHILLAS